MWQKRRGSAITSNGQLEVKNQPHFPNRPIAPPPSKSFPTCVPLHSIATVPSTASQIFNFPRYHHSRLSIQKLLPPPSSSSRRTPILINPTCTALLKLQRIRSQIAVPDCRVGEKFTSMMESARATLVLLVLACLALGANSTAPTRSAQLVRLFGDVAQSEACGPQLDIETPSCTVVEKRSNYELRKYSDSEIWVESLVANSSYEVATLTGFYRCFNFISGENSKKMKIEMTGPVETKPVPDSDGYTIGFFVPSRFKTVNDLPTPTDKNLHFYQPGGVLKAVIGPFGGFPTGKDYEAKLAELKKALDKDDLKYDESTVVFAGYSSPFQFRKRQQEVHVTVVPGV